MNFVVNKELFTRIHTYLLFIQKHSYYVYTKQTVIICIHQKHRLE